MATRTVIRIKPPEVTITYAEAMAIKTLALGKASEVQQKMALEWIMKNPGMIGGISAVAGDSHMSHFNDGRRYVALCINHILAEPISKFEQKDKK